MEELIDKLSKLDVFERLHELTLKQVNNDHQSKSDFFEDEILNLEDFPYANLIYLPESKGFRQAPTLNYEHPEWYEENFGLKVLYVKALDSFKNSEIPTLKESTQKINIYTISINIELDDTESPVDLSADSGEGYRQKEWMKILTVLGLSINTPVIVSKPVLDFLQDLNLEELKISKLSQTRLNKKDNNLYLGDYDDSIAFNKISMTQHIKAKEICEKTFITFNMLPKTSDNAIESLKLKQLKFLHLQSYLLHQQLRLELCLSLLDFIYFDSFEFEQSPFTHQLFSSEGFDFWVFNVEPITSEEKEREPYPKETLLNTFFWHLIKNGFYISYFHNHAANVSIKQRDSYEKSLSNQPNMFSSKPDLNEQAYVLLVCLLADKHVETTLLTATHLLDQQDYEDFYSLMIKSFS